MDKKRRNSVGAFGLVSMALLFLLGSHLALAQVSASISGKVEDSSGSSIPGATVTITNLETGAVRTVSTDDTGNYRALSLAVGQYEVRAEKAGFTAVVRSGLHVAVGQAAVVNMTMEVGAVQQQVTVSADVPLVNTTTASVSGLVGEKEVKELPLNGRSFDNLITLNAGAVNFTGFRVSGNPTSGVGNFFSVAGRRPGENLFLLNGVEYTGPSQVVSLPGGVSGQLLGIDAVREFNVMRDSYGAEYGKRPGAQITVVTQSGSNSLHGSVFEFLRNSKLDARNFFDKGEIPPFKRNQFGGALGGPIQKDRTFIFGNYEGFRQRLGLSSVTIVPDSNARKGLLPCVSTGTPACAAGSPVGTPTVVPGLVSGMLKYTAFWPEPNGPVLGAGLAVAYSNPKQSVREDFGTVRLDRTFSSKDSLSGIYTVDDGLSLTPAPDPLFGTSITLRNQIFSVQETHVFSPNVINVFAAGYSRAGLHYDVGPIAALPAGLNWVEGRSVGQTTVGGGVSGGGGGISSITTAGGPSYFFNYKNLFTYTDSIQLIKGSHQITAGLNFQRLQSNEPGVNAPYGTATFATLQSFLQGVASNFSFMHLNRTSPKGWRQIEGAWYLQDSIQVRPNLTLRVGLRHEFTNGWNEVKGMSANWLFDSNGVMLGQTLTGNSPLTENNAKWMFGPRVGLAWDPFGKGRTSIRTGFGIHYAIQDSIGSLMLKATPPFAYNDTILNASIPSIVPVGASTQALPLCSPTVPQPCSLHSPQGIQPNFKPPSVQEWNFSIEQQITVNTGLRLGYVGSHEIHAMVGVDLNSIRPQICSNASGCVSGGVGAARGLVPQGAQYIPVGTRLNPYFSNSFFWFSEGNASYNALQVELTKRFSHGLQAKANYTWSKGLDTNSAAQSADANTEPQMTMNPYNTRSNWGPSAQDFRHQGSLSGSYELPFGEGKPWLNGASGAAGKLASGWQLNWIVSILSGFPFTPSDGSNVSGNGDSRAPDRPSLNPAFSGSKILGNPTRWYDPNAFSLPVPGTFGNMGRNSMRGPGLGGFDLSLFKDINLTEKARLLFRAECFNILNRANFGVPNLAVFSAGAINPSAGVITSTTTTSRQIQFGMKLVF